jgi:hypothetical protein
VLRVGFEEREMTPFNMRCPHCLHAVTIVGSKFHMQKHVLTSGNVEGHRVLITEFVVCPNEDCRKFSLAAVLYAGEEKPQQGVVATHILQSWRLVPDSAARVWPEYVPAPIRADYIEACKIRDLSPKASATLARRCLQGMIRDFWKVKPDLLVREIEQIKDKVDPHSWAAIDALRKVGNIGAHMEKDISVIVDVDPGEADLMIQLVETLIEEWYVNRFEREQRMAKLVAVAEEKKAAAKLNP